MSRKDDKKFNYRMFFGRNLIRTYGLEVKKLERLPGAVG